MLPEIWQRSLYFLFIFMLTEVSGVFVGLNIRTDTSKLPSESDIVSILKAQDISHVRLFSADHKMLFALGRTGIEVIVGVPNEQILEIGESRAAAAIWVKQNIVTFVPETNISHISVGNEVLTSVPNAALLLVPAMHFLQSALVAANLNFQVKVSTPHSMDMIPQAFPPSMAAFNSTWNHVMGSLLQFLKNTGSPFMLNAQPYYSYTQGNVIFPMEYAFFQPLTPNKRIVDPNTNLYYNSMFDAMVDAAYYSMQALNFSGIPVLVTETGWPWLGGDTEPDATISNAVTYNNNLVAHVLNKSGTPSQPELPVSAYIYKMFSKDLQHGPMSKSEWGLFFPNGTQVYPVSFSSRVLPRPNSMGATEGVFCIANSSAGSKALKAGLDWACGPGGANCSAIQPRQPCYVNDITSLASYAYNDYYHRAQSAGGSCNFSNTAFITTKDPSHGACVFIGSSGSNTSSDIAAGPISPASGVSALETPRTACLTTAMLFLWWLSM